MSEKLDLADLMPKDTPDFMFSAWLGCISWASGSAEVVKQFSEETGITYTAPRSGIDRMIDEATGHHEDVIRSFVKWVNERIWGTMEAKP